MSEKQSYIVKLKKAFINACPQIINALENIITKQEELNLLSKSFAIFSLECKNETIWKWIIKSHINNSSNQENFFNDSSLAYLTLKYYFDIASYNYRNNIITATVKKIKPLCTNKINAIDLLIETVKVFIKNFRKSYLPKELKVPFNYLNEKLTKKFKDANAVILKFLFMILIPNLSDAVNSLFNEGLGELNISKDILNTIFLKIVDGSLYEEGSELNTLNVTIKNAHSKLSSYVSNQSIKKEEEKSEECNIIDKEAEIAYNCILYCVNIKKSSIVNYRSSSENLSTHQNKALFDLMGLLEEYESIVGKLELDNLSVLGIKKNSFFIRSLFKSSSQFDDNPEIKKDRVPFVKQQSERWNREHQKMLIEQRKREEDERELQERKNAYARKKSLISQDKNRIIITINEESKPVNENEIRDLKNEEETEKQSSNIDKSNETIVDDQNNDTENSQTDTITDDTDESLKQKEHKTGQKDSSRKKKKKKKNQDNENNKNSQKAKEESFTPRERSNSYQTLSPDLKKEILDYHKISVSIKNQVRQLAIDNSNQEKEKKNYLDTIEALRLEISETKASNERQLNQMFSFNSKLINSIIYRKQKRIELKNLGIALRRSLHPSFDDDMYDYSMVNPEQRCKIALEARRQNLLLRNQTIDNKVKTPKRNNETKKDSLERYVLQVIDETESSNGQLKKPKQTKGKNTDDVLKQSRNHKKRSVSEYKRRKSKNKLV